jgi:hypothetical protein
VHYSTGERGLVGGATEPIMACSSWDESRKGIRRWQRVSALTWTEHVFETAEAMLFSKVDCWFMGINSNIPGKQTRTFLLSAGGGPAYREKCDEVAANNYEGFAIQ